MAINEIFREADMLSLPVASGVKTGDPVIVGSLIGVAQTDRADSTATPPVFGGGNPDGNASVWTEGAFLLSVTGAVTVGAPIYITSAGALNVTASGNTLFGYSLDVNATSGAKPVRVKLAQV